MPILAQDIRNAMVAVVGVSGSQRYNDRNHYIPSIRGALRQFNAFVNSLLADRKGSEELLSEISILRTFQLNDMGGMTLDPDELGHNAWSVLAVYPEPVLRGNNPNPIPATADQSIWRQDLIVNRPGPKRCTRITLEQVPDTERSKMMPGSEKMVGKPMMTYAYYLIDRGSGRWAPDGFELIVLPASATPRKLIGVAYLREPNEVNALTDTISYPSSAFQLIRDLALNELSIRQGAKPLYQVTIESVRALLQAQA